MRIALDYDDTYTRAPSFWTAFLSLCREAGHDVRVVTIRDERYDRTAPLATLEGVVPVIYTRGVAKRWFCTHFTDGFMPDVWIDDRPETILRNSDATPDDLLAWRNNRAEAVREMEDV